MVKKLAAPADAEAGKEPEIAIEQESTVAASAPSGEPPVSVSRCVSVLGSD